MTSEEIEQLIRAASEAKTQVTQTMNFYAPVGEQIAHVDKIEAHFDKDMNMQVANSGEVQVANSGEVKVAPAAKDRHAAHASTPPHADNSQMPPHYKLSLLIHPAIDDDEGYRIEKEIRRLVSRHYIQDICAYLDRLAAKGKVLLPVIGTKAYDELVRLGMPVDKGGFDYKAFSKYYKKG